MPQSQRKIDRQHGFYAEAFGTPSAFGHPGWRWYNLSEFRRRSLRLGPPTEHWEQQRRQLTEAQRERMDSAEFYELLRQQITQRVMMLKSG